MDIEGGSKRVVRSVSTLISKVVLWWGGGQRGYLRWVEESVMWGVDINFRKWWWGVNENIEVGY